MNIIETTFERLPRERLVIGFEGENLRATVRIDCASVFAEYPNATPTLIVKPLFADAYPVVVDRNGTDVDWLITSEILSFSGDGEIQLVFYKDEVICKSAVSKIRVCRSLQVTGDMPDPVVQWIEDANRKLAEVDAQIVELEGMVDTATDAATRAEQSASTASAKAEQAAGSAATATEKATEATNAAETATAKAAEAALSATQASNSAVSAADSERGAIAKAAEANTAAGTATAKAEQATEAAQTATGKAVEASASATSAQASATDAAASATAASASETAAKASETAAETSATQAGTSERNAGTAAQTSTQKAAEAATSATNAAASATNAATSAETASTKAGEAAQSAQAVAETAEQLAESLEQIEQNTQDIADHEQYAEATYAKKTDLYKKADIIHNTASGAIASFPDGAEMPVDEVTAQINPVQDLHGYDHPWPAGGGKNKFETTAESKTEFGVTWTVNEDGTVSVSGTAENYTSLALGTARVDSSWGTVTISGISTATNIIWAGIVLRDDNDTIVYTVTAGSSSPTFSVDLSQYPSATKITLAVKRNNNAAMGGTIKPMVEIGSTATDWTPYTNICPITGWDGVQVWDDPRHGGLVEWNQQLRNGNFENTSNWNASAGMFTVSNNIVTVTKNENTGPGVGYIRQLSFMYVVGHKYFATIDYKGIAGKQLTLFSNGVTSGMEFVIPIDSEWHTCAKIFDVSGTPSVPSIVWLNYTTTVGDNVAYFRNYNICDLTQMFGAGNEPTTVEEFKALFPADYYPYNAGEITTVSAVNGDPYRHYSITLPTEAGTVYGGELTVNADGSGSLVVDRARVDMGELSWMFMNVNGTQRLCSVSLNPLPLTPKSDYYFPEIICSAYKVERVSQLPNEPYCVSMGFSGYGYGNRLIVNDETITTVEQATEKLSGQTCVYKLLASIAYTLTASEIRTLLGQNNIWSDAGDVSVKYNADTKLYIDNKITQAIAAALNS